MVEPAERGKREGVRVSAAVSTPKTIEEGEAAMCGLAFRAELLCSTASGVRFGPSPPFFLLSRSAPRMRCEDSAGFPNAASATRTVYNVYFESE